MTLALWFIANLIKNVILKRMSHSDQEKIEKRAKNIGDPCHDPQHNYSRYKARLLYLKLIFFAGR
jgi:hypothetical protein